MIPSARELGSIEIKGWPNAVVFDSDGKRLLAGTYGSPRCWDLATGKKVVSFDDLPSGRPEGVCWCIALPEGKQVVAGVYAAVGVWKSDGKVVRHMMSPGGIVVSIALTPDRKRVLAGTAEKELALFDLATGEMLWSVTDKKSFSNRVAISPDGKHALTAGYDKSVRLWNVSDGKALGLIGTQEGWVQALAFLPDGTRALTGGRDKTLALWDLPSRSRLLTLSAHRKQVLDLAIVAGGKRAVSVGGDGAFVWDLASGEAIARFAAHGKSVACLAVSPDGKSVVTGGEDGKLRHWLLP
jgi:WD40 repeat protein